MNPSPRSANVRAGGRFNRIEETTKAAGTKLKSSFRAVARCAGMFPPFKSALDDMSELVDILQDIVEDDVDLQDLFAEYQTSTDTLETYIAKLDSDAGNSDFSLIARSIHEHAQYVKTRRQRGILRGSDAIKCARNIEKLLKRLHEDVTLRTWENTAKQFEESLLSHLSPVHDARYNSSYATIVQRGGCTSGTRQDIQNMLQAWSRSGNDISEIFHPWSEDSPTMSYNAAKVFWMNGMAGTGKTTIAYSLCDWLKANSRLGASFFCSRISTLCQSIHTVIPTIAYQLGRFSSVYRSALCGVLRNDPDIAKQEVRVQFEALIVRPIKAIENSKLHGVVVVIDALDECGDSQGVEIILELLLTHAVDLNIKFFVTSRPELHIREKLLPSDGSLSSVIHLHDIEASVVEDDIKTYLADALKRVSPTADQLGQLAKQAGKLFIYAATLVRYIRPQRAGAASASRIRNILSIDLRRGLGPAGSSESIRLYKELDILYRKVLELAFHEDLEDEELDYMRDVLQTVVCAKEPLAVDTLAGLLRVTEDQVLCSLDPLYSVLHVPEGGGLISTLHASFPDFLLDQSRAGQTYCCDEARRSVILATSCFEIMKRQLQFNICHFKTSYDADSDVPDLHLQVKNLISSPLYYACRFWSDHLRVNLTSNTEDLHDGLCNFLSNQLLFWIEVMNLSKCMGTASSTLRRARIWLRSKNLWPETWKSLSDAERFLVQFGTSTCSLSTPHIYLSALPLCPRSNWVYINYWKRTRGLLETEGLVTQPGKTEAELMSFSANSNAIFVAFCQNGSRIFFGTPNEIGARWLYSNTATSGSFDQQIVKGKFTSAAISSDNAFILAGTLNDLIEIYAGDDGKHLGTVGTPAPFSQTCIAISQATPVYVASSHSRRIIRIWDLHSRKEISPPLEGHTGPINSIAFSPACTKLASGSNDSTVRLWEPLASSSTPQVLRGHSGGIEAVAFSPDGTFLASCSCDRTIRLWDASNGAPVGEIFEGHIDIVTSIAFAPDGTRLVSGSYDKTVRLWEVQTRKELDRFEGHTSGVSSVIFSPDGNYIASSSGKTIRLWDAYSHMLGGGLLDSGEDATGSASDLGRQNHGDTPNDLWDIHTKQSVDWVRYEMESHEYLGPPPSGNYVFRAQSRYHGDTRNVVWEESDLPITVGPQGGDNAQPERLASIIVRQGKHHAAEIPVSRCQILSVAFSPYCVQIVTGLDGRGSTAEVWEVTLPENSPHTKNSTSFRLDDKADSEVNVSGPMTLTGDGWVKGVDGELLFWFPPAFNRDLVLLRPPHLLLIASDITFGASPADHNLALGNEWAKCYVG